MMHFSEPIPISSASDAPADRVLLAAAAYLGRFRGSSRDHTQSDLRCYLTWCAYVGGKVREMRFHLLRQQTRITYWLAPGRRVFLMTVFRKTRGAETAEVARALQAQMICETQHGRAQVFDREVH